MCLEHAGDAMRIADQIREEPDGYWVEPDRLSLTLVVMGLLVWWFERG